MVSGDPVSQAGRVDVVVIGAGFAGLYAHYGLRELGLSARGFEEAGDVGGTWYWNRYPGARVDIESLQYCFHFSPEIREGWFWSERFASQPELLRYFNYVADRFDLRRDIKFNTRVVSAVFDDGTNHWTVETDNGDIVQARYCIMGTGLLSAPYRPPFPGVEDFKGEWYHTSRWPHESVDLSGKRVGVIGTGSTGIQIVQTIAPEVGHLTVFQRTANYAMPGINRPLTQEEQRAFNARHDDWMREVRSVFNGQTTAFPAPTKSALEDTAEARRQLFEDRWDNGGHPQTLLSAYNDLTDNQDSNDALCDFVREKIRSIVRDPETAELLCPKDQPVGAKRVPLEFGYFETFNRNNVTLVDAKSRPIERVTTAGLRTSDAEYELDIIVFATGFDAITGAMSAIKIGREDGPSLQELWADGPKNYLGLMVAGLPNLFIVNGPGSGGIKANNVLGVEHGIEWALNCLDHLYANGFDRIEADEQAQEDWVAHSNEVAEASLVSKVGSWYSGANIPGKHQVYMPYFGGWNRYLKICDEAVADGYRGFHSSRTSEKSSTPTIAAQ